MWPIVRKKCEMCVDLDSAVSAPVVVAYDRGAVDGEGDQPTDDDLHQRPGGEMEHYIHVEVEN